MATIQENIDAMKLAFSTHMKNKNPGYDTQTGVNIDDFSLAYATAIANAIGAGTSSIPIGDYIKKTGGADGVMSGKFTANDGFEAGFNSSKQIETSASGLILNDDIDHATGIIRGHGKDMIRHNDSYLRLNNSGEFTSGVLLGGSSTLINSKLIVSGPTSGFVTDAATLQYKQQDIYYAGNSNKNDVSWTMLNATVVGTLDVSGISIFSGATSTLHGFVAGVDGIRRIEVTTSGVDIFQNLYIQAGFGIHSRQNDDYILNDHSNGNVTLSAAGANLHIGYQNTDKVILSASLYNFNGSRKLIDQFGKGTMNWGFEAGTLGDKRFESTDQGVKLTGRLELTGSGLWLEKGISGNSFRVINSFGYLEYGAENANHFHFITDRPDFYFNKKLAAVNGFQVYNSQTRMEDDKLLLSDNHFLWNVADGIKHFGNSYFDGKIGTENFSSGFAGTGWQIDQNATATFTNLTVRNKLRVFEFEVQKITAVNGSFWVSASCSGETVTKL